MFRGSPASAVLRRRSAPLILALGLSALLLTGCGDVTAPPATPSAPAPASPSATPGDAAGEPQLVPDGTAEDNLPLFTAVTAQVWSSEQRASGRAYIDALVAAGFDRSRMQVTEDATTVGNPAESLQFSLAWGEQECLIGQVGPSTGTPVTAVMPQLAEGRCLIGTTRPIDW